MSQSKFLKNLVNSLDAKELELVAKRYLIEVDRVANVINCNGPYDSGLDLRTSDFSKVDWQYQVTVKETGFEKKLHEDLQKAKSNVDEFGLPAKVKYFYSYDLSGDAILKYRSEALVKYEIVLEIIEGNTLAQIGGLYSSIGTLLYEIADLDSFQVNDSYFSDTRVKTFYDLMSFGSSTDIKTNIIRSYVLHYLFEQSAVSVDELLKKVNSHFKADFTSTYFNGLLRRMSSEKKIYFKSTDVLELVDTERSRLTKVLKNYAEEEALLKKQVNEALKKYNLEDYLGEVINKLGKLYESNYTINLKEFTNRKTINSELKDVTIDFNEFLKEKLIDSSQSELVAKELFEIADKNDILSRLALGEAYSSVNDPDRLQEYIRQQANNKDIFIDTNFLIIALCIFYQKDVEYDDYQFKVAKQFLSFAEENQLSLVTLETYAIETASLFKDAIGLVQFTKLPFFHDLGGSNNIVYSYFSFLKENSLLHEGTNNFDDFLKEFRFDASRFNRFNNYLPQMTWLLNQLGISVELPDTYDITRARNLINEDLRAHFKRKRSFAINNDAIMLMRLGDTDSDVNPIDPVFCTWDMSLFRVRKLFFEEFPGCTEWLMFTPARLMDHFAMMKLQVRKGVLSNEVLSILQEDFSFQEKTQTLLDYMVQIINPANDLGLNYANKMAELRRDNIVQVNTHPENLRDEVFEQNPVDLVWSELFKNYVFKENKFEDLKIVFSKEEFFDEILLLLKSTIEEVKKSGNVNLDFYSHFDVIMEKSQKG